MFSDFVVSPVERSLPLPVTTFGETCPRSSTIHQHDNKGFCVPVPVFYGPYPDEVFAPAEAAARAAARRANAALIVERELLAEAELAAKLAARRN